VLRPKKLIDYTKLKCHVNHLELLLEQLWIPALNSHSSLAESGKQFMSELLERIDRLNEIGIALSAENDSRKLLELITRAV